MYYVYRMFTVIVCRNLIKKKLREFMSRVKTGRKMIVVRIMQISFVKQFRFSRLFSDYVEYRYFDFVSVSLARRYLSSIDTSVLMSKN